ncbi:MAG: non-ribosomal peptide synthase, partial [Leptolyngbya sp. SIO4C1]|nr:non-ribosomal peptide synthase [Leptolyngbya sp. SIO4C1]
LNMNLSDAVFPRSQIETFVNKSLIPKVFVPILPLPLSRFELGQYAPQASDYAARLVKLGQALAETGLFPPGFQLAQVIPRRSYRDIVDLLVNGRTGVSYGFVAYLEPPQYLGEIEISAADWAGLTAVEGYSAEELRQNAQGRRYLRLVGETGEAGDRYRQIPDVWLVSSRSGANKTDLDQSRDVLRVGLTTQLILQLPAGLAVGTADIKPSYDIYVMVAIALAAALYLPHLVEAGAPLVHFHGYPAADWFTEQAAWAGVENPSVPCGTYESGAFNFLNIARLRDRADLRLAALIEPDHGTNILADDLDYLLERLQTGCQQGQVELGGKQFSSLLQ